MEVEYEIMNNTFIQKIKEEMNTRSVHFNPTTLKYKSLYIPALRLHEKG